MLRGVLFNVFPASRCRALVAVAVVGLSLGRADAQSYTFSPFDLTVSDSTAFVDLYTVANDPLPYMGYSTVTITAEWSAVSGDPWSNQARAVLWNMDTFPPEVDYFTPGAAYTGAAGNSSSTTLTWIGYMEQGGFIVGSGLYFGARQTSPGSIAQWNNVTVTLSNLDLPPNHEIAVIGQSVSFQLTPLMMKWYKYTVDTAGRYIFDTEGSSLSTDRPWLGLYNADGQRIDSTPTSQDPVLLDLTLTPGDYFLVAAGSFNPTFRDDFGVISRSTATGTIVINSHAFPVPEPTSAATLGLASLALLRRTRRVRAD